MATADRRQEGTGALHVLPDHVLSQIFCFFSYKELVYYSGVSAAFYVFCNDETLWQEIFIQDTNSTFTYDGSWKHATLLKFKKTTKELELPKRLHFEGVYSMFLYARWYRAHIDVASFGEDKGDIERKKLGEFTAEQFISNYDAMSRPVLITSAIEHWQAHKNWSRENLLNVYGDTDFKVSERGSRKFKMKLKDYLRYLDVQHDEEPLYIFDSGFGERAPDMLKDYDILKYFPDDYFNLLGKYKPSFRWFVMGPPRSGAPWHVDPAGTSAWNALLHGRKRWLLYPPGGMPPGVIPRISSKGEHIYVSPSSLLWLLEVYPFLDPEDKPIECIQNPGEVIFVPAGWWHMVLNMEESVAVTQNYANESNFNAVCEDFFGDRREIYFYFKEKMLEAKPEFAKNFDQFEKLTDEITADFDDVEFWSPYVTQVLKQHNLPVPGPLEIEALSDGTNPVFIANNMVVKFYSKHYGGQRNFEAETGMYASAEGTPISDVCPKLLAHGKIEVSQSIKAKPLDRHSNNMTDGADFPELPTKLEAEKTIVVENEKPEGTGTETEKSAYPAASAKGKSSEITVSSTWPYLVMSYISGSNLLTAREEEMEIDMIQVASFLARNAMVIHGLKVAGGKEKEDPRDDYMLFLQKRRDKVLKTHWLWRALSPTLIQQIDAYLPANLQDIVCFEHVVTIHGDLTDENVIGVEVKEQKPKKTKQQKHKGKKAADKPKKTKTSKWEPKYLIDFGDSRQGDIVYELVSLFISVFECNKSHLEVFFKNYTIPNSSQTLWEYYKENKESMVKKLMSCTLLHECNALLTAFRHVPDAAKSATLDDLASALWEL